MQTSDSVRTQLRSFLGDEDYRKLLPSQRMLVGKEPRLRYWQEKLIDRFLETLEANQLSRAQVLSALRACPVHEVELRQQAVPVIQGCIDYAPGRVLRFPHAAVEEVYTEGAPVESFSCLVWHCPECTGEALRTAKGEA
jgi:hypothetical protein